VLFIPPGVRHGATIVGSTSVLVVQFDLAFLHPELPLEASRCWSHPATLARAPELLPFLAQPFLRFRAGGRFLDKLRDDWTSLVTPKEPRVIGDGQYRRAHLSMLLLEIVRIFENDILEIAESSSTETSDKIEQVNEFIRNNLSSRISIQHAARHLAISPSRLATKIKKATNHSFGDLLMQARIQRACELLLYTEKRISEVAFESGFEDHAYFSRRFRQELGITPQEYRKQRDVRLSGVPIAEDESTLATRH